VRRPYVPLLYGVEQWNVRPSHLRCHWTNDMELVPKQFAWAGHANWLFSSYTEDVSVSSVLGTLSVEAFFCDDALYKLTFTLHYIIHQYGDWYTQYTGRCWVGCYIWYSEEGPGRAAAPLSPLLDVPNVTTHPSTASVPTSYHSIWQNNCFCTLKG